LPAAHASCGINPHSAKYQNRGIRSMLRLDRSEIMRIAEQLLETQVRSQRLIEDSKRIIQDYRNTVIVTRRILKRSQEVRARAMRVPRVP
jgi:hypothetical protein